MIATFNLARSQVWEATDSKGEHATILLINAHGVQLLFKYLSSNLYALVSFVLF